MHGCGGSLSPNAAGPHSLGCQERRLLTTRLIRPDYSTAFRCIGPACEDTCCAGWRVDLDQASYRRMQPIPEGPLKTLVDASIVRGSTPNASLSPSAFAQIRMPTSGRCPIL